MIKRIELDLFARLMRLSPDARNDLLEFIGQSPVRAQDVISAEAIKIDQMPDPAPSGPEM